MRSIVFLATLLLCTAAISSQITVLTHDSFAVSKAVIDNFTEQTGIKVTFLYGGDAGAVINRAILTKEKPIADLLYGVDNSLLGRAKNVGIFEPYQSSHLNTVPEELRFDPNGFVTPINVGYVAFNMDINFFKNADLKLPNNITDLTESAYNGMTVIENPATSSPGLAFLLTTIGKFGENTTYDWLDFWKDLRNNDVTVTEGWNEAYYGSFSRYGGDRPVVLSYATSPAAEVIFSSPRAQEALTSNLFCNNCVWRQIEGIGILAGTKKQKEARMFIDFMLSPIYQADIPLNMFVYPAVENIILPEDFKLFASKPKNTDLAMLSPDAIEGNQERWLLQWTQVVLQGRDPQDVR